ncbi:unknown [Bacteroides sp. CAG:702]|nr:unknown [Bacteroides sp. CAG:702]
MFPIVHLIFVLLLVFYGINVFSISLIIFPLFLQISELWIFHMVDDTDIYLHDVSMIM